MIKKEGVIQVRLTQKPSFKNLMDVQRQKISTPTKNKPSKNTSQTKVGVVPNKSPKKLIPRSIEANSYIPNISQHASENSQKSQIKYEDINSEINRSKTSVTPKKDKVAQESMKKIILLKNKVVQLQEMLGQQQKILNVKQKKGKVKNDCAGNKPNLIQINMKVKKIQNNLDEYFNNFKSESEKLEKKKSKHIQEEFKNIEEEQIMRNIAQMSNFNKEKYQTGFSFSKIQSHLKSLQQILK